jgi:hypothetical protein
MIPQPAVEDLLLLIFLDQSVRIQSVFYFY